MAKFRLGSTAVFTIGGNAVPCPTAFAVDESLDVYISDCAANATKEHVLGAKAVSGSFSGEIEHNGATAFAYVAPSATGVALVLQPAGNTAGNITITSSAFKISSRSLSVSSTGLTTYTCNYVMDNITVGTI